MFFGFGIPELFILAFAIVPLGGVVLFWVMLGRRAKRLGYPSTRSYRAPLRGPTSKYGIWVTALGAVAACVAIALWSPSAAGARFDVTWAPVLAAGLALYGAGLFAPLSGNGRRSR